MKATERVKYGIIDYSYGGDALYGSLNKYYVNIGNDMQSLAVEYMYQRLGIDEDCIVRVGYHELRTYSKNYVVLPMNMFGSKDEIFPLSPYIIPLYIGFNYVSGKIQDNFRYVKPFEPVGCRDEYTLRVMRGAGIEAYLSGCLTLALPRRSDSVDARKVFLVDVPEGIDAFIPENMRDHVEYVTHEIELDYRFTGKDIFKATREYARFMLNRYAEEAALVVTSRLHCAAPCMALGIPVILVKDNIDVNLSWIDKFTRIYSCEDFSEIDWYPNPVDLEEVKDCLIDVFSRRLKELVDSRVPLYELSSYLENREKANYNNKILYKLREAMGQFPRKGLRYVIWGAGAGGTLAHMLIRDEYPDYRMVAVVDSFEKGSFFGVEIFHPDALAELEYDFLFICTYSGREEARRKVEEFGFHEYRDYMVLVSHVVNSHKESSESFKCQLSRFMG